MDQLFQRALDALGKGDFSRLEIMLGGPDRFDTQIIDWCEEGKFETEPEMLAEVLTCACMLGRTTAARYLLDKSVDPLAGIKTGLNGFHYAASGGRLDIIRLLVERKVPMEVENMYGGTVLGQALWSAVNEYTPDHADVIEALIDAGAMIEPGTLEWWNEQDVPSQTTKKLVSSRLEG
jgi:hypothetical protein